MNEQNPPRPPQTAQHLKERPASRHDAAMIAAGVAIILLSALLALCGVVAFIWAIWFHQHGYSPWEATSLALAFLIASSLIWHWIGWDVRS